MDLCESETNLVSIETSRSSNSFSFKEIKNLLDSSYISLSFAINDFFFFGGCYCSCVYDRLWFRWL